MNKLWLCIYPDGGVLLEEQPSDNCIEVKLPDAEMAVLASLMKLDSFALAKCLGSLAWFSIGVGHSQSRRVTAA